MSNVELIELSDRVATLQAILITLITSLEKTNSIRREDWTGTLRDLLKHFQDEGASETAQLQIKEILQIYDPQKRIQDQPPKYFPFRVIPGGIDSSGSQKPEQSDE